MLLAFDPIIPLPEFTLKNNPQNGLAYGQKHQCWDSEEITFLKLMSGFALSNREVMFRPSECPL
jgi:hypothetical protein